MQRLSLARQSRDVDQFIGEQTGQDWSRFCHPQPLCQPGQHILQRASRNCQPLNALALVFE